MQHCLAFENVILYSGIELYFYYKDKCLYTYYKDFNIITVGWKTHTVAYVQNPWHYDQIGYFPLFLYDEVGGS